MDEYRKYVFGTNLGAGYTEYGPIALGEMARTRGLRDESAKTRMPPDALGLGDEEVERSGVGDVQLSSSET